MVKRGRAERAASAGARVAGSGVGAGVGRALSSPFGLGALGVVALIAGLIIFRSQISNFFNNLPSQIAGGIGDISISLPDIKFPDISFPDFKFPDITFPEITFPEIKLPEFLPNQESIPKLEEGEKGTGLLEGFVGGEGGEPKLPDDKNLFQTVILDPLLELLTPAQKFAAEKSGISGTQQLIDFLGLEFAPPAAAEVAPAEPTIPDQSLLGFDDTVLNLIGTEQVFTGGGQGFQGGVINPTPITTLTQVLDLFPQITASQAADFLSEFSGILPEAALMQGFDIINITGDPSQPILDQPSSLGTVGQSPEELFKFLFPNVISNF